MVYDDMVGVIAGSSADPCNLKYDFPYDYDEECHVYDVMTCDKVKTLPGKQFYTVEDITGLGPHKELPGAPADATDQCLSIIDGRVYDLVNRQIGVWTFANKHGGGKFSNAPLEACECPCF